MSSKEIYRLGLPIRVFISVWFIAAPLAGVVGLLLSLRNGDVGGFLFVSLWLAAVLAQAWWMVMWQPWRVELDDVVLRFVARSRQVEVPWPSLRSVRTGPLDPQRQSIIWTWDGGRLRTIGAWQQQRDLLTAVIARAPQAQVRVLPTAFAAFKER